MLIWKNYKGSSLTLGFLEDDARRSTQPIQPPDQRSHWWNIPRLLKLQLVKKKWKTEEVQWETFETARPQSSIPAIPVSTSRFCITTWELGLSSQVLGDSLGDQQWVIWDELQQHNNGPVVIITFTVHQSCYYWEYWELWWGDSRQQALTFVDILLFNPYCIISHYWVTDKAQ